MGFFPIAKQSQRYTQTNLFVRKRRKEYPIVEFLQHKSKNCLLVLQLCLIFWSKAKSNKHKNVNSRDIRFNKKKKQIITFVATSWPQMISRFCRTFTMKLIFMLHVSIDVFLSQHNLHHFFHLSVVDIVICSKTCLTKALCFYWKLITFCLWTTSTCQSYCVKWSCWHSSFLGFADLLHL